MAICMFSLAGVPPLVGFYAKLSVLQALIASGQALYMGLAIFAEVVCSTLLIAGLFTRLAALILAITMATAFFFVHKSALVGPQSGELAMVYLVAYVTLLFTGPGKFSVDRA